MSSLIIFSSSSPSFGTESQILLISYFWNLIDITLWFNSFDVLLMSFAAIHIFPLFFRQIAYTRIMRDSWYKENISNEVFKLALRRMQRITAIPTRRTDLASKSQRRQERKPDGTETEHHPASSHRTGSLPIAIIIRNLCKFKVASTSNEEVCELPRTDDKLAEDFCFAMVDADAPKTAFWRVIEIRQRLQKLNLNQAHNRVQIEYFLSSIKRESILIIVIYFLLRALLLE